MVLIMSWFNLKDYYLFYPSLAQSFFTLESNICAFLEGRRAFECESIFAQGTSIFIPSFLFSRGHVLDYWSFGSLQLFRFNINRIDIKKELVQKYCTIRKAKHNYYFSLLNTEKLIYPLGRLKDFKKYLLQWNFP